jgi:hypothetical protein
VRVGRGEVSLAVGVLFAYVSVGGRIEVIDGNGGSSRIRGSIPIVGSGVEVGGAGFAWMQAAREIVRINKNPVRMLELAEATNPKEFCPRV